MVHLDALEVDHSTEAFRVRVHVDRDGRGTLEACAAGSLCQQVAELVSRGTFEAARDEQGRPIAARVTLEIAPRSLEMPEPSATEETEESSSPPPAELPEPDASAPSFTARAEVPVVAGTRRFELRELRDVPGAFGDPFRSLESLPGVVPIVTGLPAFYLRGSPPASTLYVYDELPLPMLFHLGIGPGVIHPRMLGSIRLHPGVAPARYGRHTGGVVLAEGPSDRDITRPAGEVDLRLLDLNGYVEAPVLGGAIAGAVRIGYPGLLISLITPNFSLSYYDYQLRGAIPIARNTELRLVWIGSIDSMATKSSSLDVMGNEIETSTTLTVQFHRGELRIVHREGEIEFGSALRLGFEESGIDSQASPGFRLGLSAVTVGPRLWMEMHEGIARLRVGADGIASFGKPSFSNAFDPSKSAMLRLDDVFLNVGARQTSGIHGELSLALLPEVTLELGARIDAWVMGRSYDLAFDPRVRITYTPIRELELHVAGGVTHQPASYLLPLPGIADVPLTRGLQSAIQGEAGAKLELEWFTSELVLFYHRYDNLLFTDVFTLASAGQVCTRPGGGCREVAFDERVKGNSYGGEFFLKLPDGLPVIGWLSYTLSWSDVEPLAGIPLRPSYDVRHVLSLVAQWNVGSGFSLGGRFFVRSGSPRGVYYSDRGSTRRHEQELDAYYRLDVQAAYSWDAGWARMRVSLDVLNATLSTEPIGLSCMHETSGPPSMCTQDKVPMFLAPNLGLRAEF